jgi:hypothetical protein
LNDAWRVGTRSRANGAISTRLSFYLRYVCCSGLGSLEVIARPRLRRLRPRNP